MRKPKVLEYPDMTVIMRKDFYDHFEEHLKQIEKETGATYIGHNIIKNYRENGHTVSTFCNFEPWHELYWDNYRNEDPLERTIHHAVKKDNFGVVSWEIGHNSSPCSRAREELTKVKEGVNFSFKRPDNHIETMVLGWRSLNSESLDTDYIFHLSSLLNPIREHHWKVYNKK